MKKNALEIEILKIEEEIEGHAKASGLTKEFFLNSLDSVEAGIANTMIPLLKKQISLLKLLWETKAAEEKSFNLVLFTRTR